MVRRAPLGDDRQDLDALVPTGEPARRLLTSMASVAVDGNREDVGSQQVPRVSRGLWQAAMKLTGYKTRSVFERYNIVSDGDLGEAARRLDMGRPKTASLS